MGVAEIIGRLRGELRQAELLVEAQAFLEMRGGFLEAGLFEQDRAEIDIRPGDPVFVLHALFEL